MKYAYKIIDGAGNLSCYQYNDESSELSIKILREYTYIFDTPLEPGSKIIEGKVVAPAPVQVPEAPQPIELTAEEIKKQKYNEINWQYQDKLRKLRDSLAALTLQGLATDKIKEEYTLVMIAYKDALLAVYNA